MSSTLARTGRLRQRYKDQLRLVAGCIPYKIDKNVEDQSGNMETRVLLLMISTPNHTDFVFPKGGWEDDETLHEAASREALEEAGVKGILAEIPLGVWEFRSKSRQNSCSLEGGCRGYMFAMEVTEELHHWPEQSIYSRKWVGANEAVELCRYDWMRDAVKKFLATLSGDKIHVSRDEQANCRTNPVCDVVAEPRIKFCQQPIFVNKSPTATSVDECC